MGPSIQKTFLFFSLLMLFTACSSSLTELKNSQITVIFDYQTVKDKPSAHIAAFSEASNNVRRCKEIRLICKENDYQWDAVEPVKFQFNNKNFAGYTNFVMPAGEKILEGLYDLYYKEVDEHELLYTCKLKYDNRFYKADSSEAQDIINKGGFTQKLAVYDENHVLLYLGEYKPELKTVDNLLNKYKTADTRRVIWFANDNSIACMMVPEKLNNENNKE